MALMQLIAVDLAVGGPKLLDAADFAIEPGERVCLIGRNGTGKSTLLRLLNGDIAPDSGEIRRQQGIRVAMLEQEVPREMAGTVFEVTAAGLGDVGRMLARYHVLSQALSAHPELSDEMAHTQAAIEACDGWSLEQRVTTTLDKLDLPEDKNFAELSGGLKRRVLLARAMVQRPDVLLLDEPTNHLDIDAISWLQTQLGGFPGALLFVTHDRAFLRALAGRIVELDRGQLHSFPGDYDNFLRRREERLHAEAQENARFDKRMAEEEVWIRQGIKARRTRNEGRVRALKAMRREHSTRQYRPGEVRLNIETAGASGRRVVEALNVSHHFGEHCVIRNFSSVIQRGDRVGLVGPNGSGKTTLLRLLLGEMTPTDGEIRVGTGLQIAYFDQYRSTLREDWNALDNVAEGAEFIDIGGNRRHVLSWLQDFLFTPERARAPITRLSGGERNRLLLARLFARPSNLLVLDEPTNDLDVETLELLEERIGDYPGTLLLVSHDREFLDNVVTQVLVMEGDGKVGEYVGGYSDWLQRRAELAEEPTLAAAASQRSAATTPGKGQPPAAKSTKLSYKLQRELAALPAQIEVLETRQAQLAAEMADPAFFRQSPEQIGAVQQQLASLQAELEGCYARWESLEG